jgi:hypothetical protein
VKCPSHRVRHNALKPSFSSFELRLRLKVALGEAMEPPSGLGRYGGSHI